MDNGTVTGILEASGASGVSAAAAGGTVGAGDGEALSVGSAVVTADDGTALSWRRFILFFYRNDNVSRRGNQLTNPHVPHVKVHNHG